MTTRLFFLIYVFAFVTFFSFNISADTIFAEPMREDWDSLLNHVSESGSASWYATMFVMVQAFFLIFRTTLGDLLGIYKLLVLASLSLTVTILSNVMAGKSIFESLFLDSGTLMAYQVLAYQVKKQWEKRRDESVNNTCSVCGVRLCSEQTEA